MAEQAAEAVYLARHGETDDNREPLRFQGFRDTELNREGLRQAAELAARAELLGIASLWSSDLRRARRTAEIVGRGLGLSPRLDARLREANRGRWEGRFFHEVAAAEPELFSRWLQAGDDWRFPGGESLAEQQDRVMDCLQDIRRTAQPPALAVCHGGSIRVVLCARDPRGLAAFHSFRVPNVAVVAA